MPVLSLHNSYTLPSGSASYTLGLSGAPGATSYTYPSAGGVSLGGVNVNSILGTTGLSGASQMGAAGISALVGTSGLGLSSNNPLSSTLPIGFNTTSYSTYTNPLLTSGGMSMKLKTFDELDLVTRYGNRAGTPSSPIPPVSWGLDTYGGLDGVNPTFMHTHGRHGGLDLERKHTNFFWTQIQLIILKKTERIYSFFIYHEIFFNRKAANINENLLFLFILHKCTLQNGASFNYIFIIFNSNLFL